MASYYIGGLSGAFIPVSEDAGMVAAVEAGAMSLEKLEARPLNFSRNLANRHSCGSRNPVISMAS